MSLIPAAHAGLLIGTRGENINAMRKDIGGNYGNFNVCEKNLPHSTERLAVFSGGRNQIFKFISTVVDFDLYSRGCGDQISLYNPNQNKNAPDLNDQIGPSKAGFIRRGYTFSDKEGDILLNNKAG